jgi:NAD(P)-dependent dehydrogenase (short-subunit alcohol dehydrogenase family)
MLDEWAGLDGQVAIITGGAGGLGKPITLDLARAGVRVAVADRDPAAVEDIKAELGDAALLVSCFDVRDDEALAGFFAAVIETYGRLDILVNVPGGSFWSPILDVGPRGVDAIIRQNFTYALNASVHAARQMQTQETGGSIIQITSIEGHRAMPGMAVYGAMKSAVAHLCKSLALEWGPYGIRVNAIAPDIFPTPATSGAGMVEPVSEELQALNDSISIPMGRRGAGTDLSGCVLFLASRLSAYVTGTTLHVDGGTSAAAGWFHFPGRFANTMPANLLPHVTELPPLSF